MSEGNFIKLYRATLKNPVVMKDADHLAIWIWLLLNVTYSPKDVWFNGQRTTLKPGQMTTGRKRIANELSVSESKVQRILKVFESEHMIEQVTDHRSRLISIVSWSKYQSTEQVFEQEVNNFRTGSEQVLNTNKEIKNIRNKELIEKENKKKKTAEPKYIREDLPQKVEEALDAYVEMRKKHRWDFGQRAQLLFFKKLDELSNGDEDLAVAIIDQATLNNYRSVYPIKESWKYKNNEPRKTYSELAAEMIAEGDVW